MKTKNQTGLTIGIDLGDRRHTVCVLNAAGDIIAEEVLTSTREVLVASPHFTATVHRSPLRSKEPEINLDRTASAFGVRVRTGRFRSDYRFVSEFADTSVVGVIWSG